MFLERSNFPKQRLNAILKLDVNRDEIRSRLGKWIKQNLRLGAHEMRVEK